MFFSPRVRSSSRVLALAAFAAGVASTAQAATFRFDTDPFAGSVALETPGRQTIGGELFVPTFDLDADIIEVASGVFDIEPEINFFNGFAADLPDARFNFIALRDFDFDDNMANGVLLNAGLAADLIAARITQPGAGFFLYFNTGLNVSRLVYSTDLSSSTADLKVVARFQDKSGQRGIDDLDRWGPQMAVVPEPGTWCLLIAGFGLAGGALRRARRSGALSA